MVVASFICLVYASFDSECLILLVNVLVSQSNLVGLDKQ